MHFFGTGANAINISGWIPSLGFETSVSQPTGRGRFQTDRGLTFFYFEWLNALKLAKNSQLWVVENFFL